MDKEKQSYDEDSTYTLRSRIIVFEEEMERLKKLMYGELTSIWVYMTDSQGKYSEKNTVKMVDQIVDGDLYRKMHIWDYDKQADKLPFYKDLLYSVLRTCTSGYVECEGGNRFGYGSPEEISFSHIISVFDKYELGLLDGNIVFLMEKLYEIFSQKKIYLDALHHRQEMAEMVDEDVESETEAYESMEEEWAREHGVDINEIREAEQRRLDESERQSAIERKKVMESFEEKEHFCQSIEEVVSYLEARNVSAGQLSSEMRELIVEFLFDRGTPVFLDEEAYVEVMVQLKKTIRTAQRYAEDRT